MSAGSASLRRSDLGASLRRSDLAAPHSNFYGLTKARHTPVARVSALKSPCGGGDRKSLRQDASTTGSGVRSQREPNLKTPSINS